jgi:uncharacterized protein involved in exopolysaccharide biosynthesis
LPIEISYVSEKENFTVLSMKDYLKSTENDEIDLAELLYTFWAYKFFLLFTCIVGIFLSGYYYLNASKQFTSIATFKLSENAITLGNTNTNINARSNALSSLAGFGMGFGVNIIHTDEVMGREFIKALDQSIDFRGDPFFNTYNPNAIDPIWKSTIKNLIRWNRSETDIHEEIWQSITQNYINNIELNQTKEGSIQVLSKHENAYRSAEIANAIMENMLNNFKIKRKVKQTKQLNYLAQTLAKSLSDLKETQSKVKNFTLKNSTLPIERFTSESLKLEKIRQDLSQTLALHKALSKLGSLLETGENSHEQYILLRKENPIIDKVEFRRVLGQNEIISSWDWPDLSTVRLVFDTIDERKKRLENEENTAKITAENAGEAVEQYSDIQRDAEFAEATYTVLIEQVKAQSLMAGYNQDSSEIYEYAAPPLSPSTPRRNLILIIGATVGFFIGCVLILIYSAHRGVYYSKKSLIFGAQTNLSFKSKSFKSLNKLPLAKIYKRLSPRSHEVLRNLAVRIHNSKEKYVVVTSSNPRLFGFDISRALASYMNSDDMKIGIINFSDKSQKIPVGIETDDLGLFYIDDNFSNVSILKPNSELQAIDLVSKHDFHSQIDLLRSKFNLIFLCADNNHAISLLSSLSGQNIIHITIARLKKTKSETLNEMIKHLPIQGLLYE